MENKVFSVAILGIGGRGGDTYGNILMNDKHFKIVSLCDLREDRLKRFGEKYGVSKENLFTDENQFFKEKRADLIVIATQDDDHVRHALKAFEKGYDMLVEKPLTAKEEECKQLLEAQKKYGGKVLVCHVLRYAPAFNKVAEMVHTGMIGKLICIDALERVSFWHQAHSYVRGNWRTTKSSAPMILAKCCHDLDLLQFYAQSPCESISSVGDLAFFKKENMPKDATHRCIDCPHKDSCVYSAKKIYIDNWIKNGKLEDTWPYNIIAPAPLTQEKLEQAIRTGDYGRCVFDCDNDVVDHEITTMTFKNGVKASLTMTAFTATGGRRMVFHGTEGEIEFDESENTIKLMQYFKDPVIINTADLTEGGYGHGGGDSGMIGKLYDMLCGKTGEETSLKASIESHLMGIYAEKSRLNGGELMFPHKN